MLLPKGFVLRLRSSADAKKFSAALDVQHVCKRREIILQEAVEIRSAPKGAAAKIFPQ